MSVCQAIRYTDPGEVVKYWTGHLQVDCELGLPAHVENARRIRREAWAAYEARLCHLVQRRVDDNVFEYLAIRRPT